VIQIAAETAALWADNLRWRYKGEALNAEAYCTQGDTYHKQRDFDLAIACYAEVHLPLFCPGQKDTTLVQ
jgi:hypothetical protein